MVKFSSRLLGVLMVFALLASTFLPSVSSAAESEKSEEVQVIKDNNEGRVAQAVKNGVVTKATFDKEENILRIEEEGKETVVLDLGKISEKYLANGSISDGTSKPSGEFGVMATTRQNTFINYEYTITHGSPERWQLRRPQGDSLFHWYYKNVTRNGSNATNLRHFQTAVENIDYYEWRAIGTSLTTVGLSWLAFILSVPTAGAGTLTAGLAALGAYGATLDALINVHRHANYARTYYFRV